MHFVSQKAKYIPLDNILRFAILLLAILFIHVHVDDRIIRDSNFRENPEHRALQDFQDRWDLLDQRVASERLERREKR